MTLRTDHISGAAFVIFGLVVLAMSNELPFGRLSMPGAGFLPKLVTGLLILFGAALMLRASRESSALSEVAWNDLPHAAAVVVITGAAITLYTSAGFNLTMFGLMFALLILLERQNPVRAALYSAAVTLIAFGLFTRLLKAPLPVGPFGL